MALNPLIDSRDVRFVLYEMLQADKLTAYPEFSSHDKDIFEDTINLAERIAVEHFYPTNMESDKTGGVEFNPETNEVKVPELLREAWKAYTEAGFIMLRMGTGHGGMGMPDVISTACDEFFQAGNSSLWMYGALTLGAAHLITLFGTEEQKKLYISKMISGKWGGTMCLTEPDAGTDVGSLKTKAVKQEDGTYLITGQKIFISAGEYDLVDNIVHTVLARIEGHPGGTKGISVFIVPKYLVKPDGSIGDRNDVICTGIEHKMGIKSSSTAALSFGDNGKCTGYLLGEEQKGMSIMFKLMNMARIETGLQAQSQSSAAYMHAVTYARNRVQGVHLTQMLNPDAPSVAIVEHPDVKRMLLWMKCYIEGMRMLSYYVSWSVDISHVGKNDDAKKAGAVVELLTPVVKAGISDMSWLITSEAMQVFGGYGYCSDYKVEQYARDTKIFSIYEGANGMQSLDLAFRKILFNENMFFYNTWKEAVTSSIADAKGKVDDKYITPVELGLNKLEEVIRLLKSYMDGGKFLLIAMNTQPLLQCMFMMNLAWMHLWSLAITQPKMKEITGSAKGEERQKIIDSNSEAAYYTGKVLSSQYYIGAELPKYFGRIDSILGGEAAVVKTSPAVFTGAPEE
jgi:alkylation response protein AidB-like acyl-CoA dehydrogenase